MTTIARRLEAQYPESNAGWGAEVVGLREQMVGEIRPALLVFMGAVGAGAAGRLRQRGQPDARAGGRARAGR